MLYADLTRNTKEPLKRLAHGRRLAGARHIVPLRPDMRILDYGCGDAAFLEVLAETMPIGNLCGYDPRLLDQATLPGAWLYDDVAMLRHDFAGEFDVLYCMQVCEHMTDAAMDEVFANLRVLGKRDATFVFGVPIETGTAGFAKNIYRTLKANRQQATLGRAFRALFGLPVPRMETRPGWISSHVGFDWRRFVGQLHAGGFEIVARKHLPWPALGTLINNEVYLVCRME